MLKQDLRIKYKQLRAELSNEEKDFRSRLVAGHLAAYFDLTGKKISCFVPIDRFNEINTWLVLDVIKAKFYLPVIGENDHLKHIHYTGKENLKKNSWGILEPVSGTEISPDELDIVLVPLLTLDKRGFRVGYGKGYYDQFLVQCSPACIFIGLYQFENFEEIDDLHPADIPLHYAITPKGIHTLNPHPMR